MEIKGKLQMALIAVGLAAAVSAFGVSIANLWVSKLVFSIAFFGSGYVMYRAAKELRELETKK